MNYIDIVSIIMSVIGVVVAIFPIEYAILFIAGLFAKQKTFPEAKEKLKYGVVIAGRNEEKVIGNLIESIKKCNYPQDKIDVFVVAHNCTDNTANVARESGGGNSQVYEYNNPSERTKGYALKYIFKKIDEDFGIMNYDGFIVFDADNILDSEFFNKINDAFIANERKCAITSFRNSKNFGTNNITACYGLLYIANCTLESCGRMAMNCSARILGSGFLVSSEMVKDGWNITILSDDTDFTAEQIIGGNKVIYCNDAMYYDEHPTKFKAMWRQRFRWAKGTHIVCGKRFKDLFKTMFKRKRKNDTEKIQRFSAFDMICVVLPIGLIGLIIMLLNLFLLALTPLFGGDVGSAFVWWAIGFGFSSILAYLGLVCVAGICYYKERKRIKNVSTKLKITSILIYPIFASLLILLQLFSAFTRKFVWKQIEHKDVAKFETFNETSKDVLTENVLTSESVELENDVTKEGIERGEVK